MKDIGALIFIVERGKNLVISVSGIVLMRFGTQYRDEKGEH
jgi:hypothetical protein